MLLPASASFSAGVNILALTGSVYMPQLYDRVLPAHSIPTLVGLTLIMLLLYAGFGVFDFLRTQVLSRIGVRFKRAARSRVLGRDAAAAALGRRGGQPVRNLDQVRGFLDLEERFPSNPSLFGGLDAGWHGTSTFGRTPDSARHCAA